MGRKGVGIMTTQSYICPNCGGRGCPVCQGTGSVTLSEQEVEQLQKLATKVAPEFMGQPMADYSGIYPDQQKERQIRNQLAGILTLVLLAALSVSAFLSWFYAHTFKPFLQFWSLIITLLLLKPLSSLKFFQEEKVNDFLEALQEEGIKIKVSPFYPLL